MDHRSNRRQCLAALMATAAWPLLSPAAANAANSAANPAAYPAGPVTLLVPFSAGGQFDTIARELARPIGSELGVPVIVENIGGAGGNIAASKAARARPDGQTLLVYGGNYSIARELYRKLDYDPVADFAPISRMSIAPHVVMAAPGSGIQSFDQLLKRARGGARLAYGSPGVGTSMHLTFEILKDHFGFDALHVPYKGGSNVLTDLAGGQIDLGIIAVGPALAMIRAGKVVPLAVTSRQRSPALPQVPAIAELGMPDLDTGSWTGLVAPRKTPQASIDRLNASVATALRSAAVKEMFAQQSFIATPGTPAELWEFNQRETERYAPVIRRLNLQNQ